MGRLLYFICTTNRSGSSWLCHMLNSTGVAGSVGEIVDKTRPDKEWRDNSAAHPYGIKLNPSMMRRIWPLVAPEEKRNARFVWLVRRDSWRQAISQYRAEQSRVWHLWRGKSIPEDHSAVAFNATLITEMRDVLLRQNRLWRQWFQENGVRPLKISYERLSIKPEKHVRRVLDHLSLACDRPISTGTLQITRDEITDDWVRQLTADNDSDSWLTGRAFDGTSQTR